MKTTEGDIKRLFFGIELHAPWPSHLPNGRVLEESHRHLTLAFLGNVLYLPLKEALNGFPTVPFKIGPVGYFDSCLMQPPRHPHVVAWHAHWLDDRSPMADFQKTLSDWLLLYGYKLDKRPWKPHATLCRQPFDAHAWMKDFFPLPFYATTLHLYESVGDLHYVPIWSYPIKAPFEEVNHTADIAFIIRGENLQQLYFNAFTALAFKAPEFIQFFNRVESFDHLDEIIIALNQIVSRLDYTIGSPLKAVSFHGDVVSVPGGILQWEMIVDV